MNDSIQSSVLPAAPTSPFSMGCRLCFCQAFGKSVLSNRIWLAVYYRSVVPAAPNSPSNMGCRLITTNWKEGLQVCFDLPFVCFVTHARQRVQILAW